MLHKQGEIAGSLTAQDGPDEQWPNAHMQACRALLCMGRHLHAQAPLNFVHRNGHLALLLCHWPWDDTREWTDSTVCPCTCPAMLPDNTTVTPMTAIIVPALTCSRVYQESMVS